MTVELSTFRSRGDVDLIASIVMQLPALGDKRLAHVGVSLASIEVWP